MVSKPLTPGEVFHRLTVVADLGIVALRDGVRRRYAECFCECGTVVVVRATYLRNGHTRSCGCYMRDQTIKHNSTHGHTSSRRSSAYVVWYNMLQRCRNPKNPAFKNYGGRGIKVTDSWMLFENFYADMGDPPPKLTLERIDNNKGVLQSELQVGHSVRASA